MRKLPAIVVVTVVSCGAALAQEGMTPWGDAGAWQILIDPEVGNGCFMQRTFEDGTTVHVGAVPDRQGGFFAAMNPKWTEIAEGQEGVLVFDFGDAKFGGAALGIMRAGLPGGYAFFDNPAFVDEFGKRNSVQVAAKQGDPIEFDLKGSKKAIAAVRACQAEQPKQEP